MNRNADGAWLLRGLNTLADLVLASLLWLVCSLPVVTAGLAGAALYHTVELAVVQGRGSVTSTFLRSLRESWRSALPAGAVSLLTGGAACWGAYLCLTDPGGVPLLPLAGCALLLLFWLAAQIYIYPLIGHFVLNARQLLELTAQLIILHPLKSAGLTALWLCVAACAVWYPPLLMILPAGFTYLASKIYTPLFFRYIRVPPEGWANPPAETSI